VAAFGAAFPPARAPARRCLLARGAHPGPACGDVYEGFRVPDHDATRALLAACGGTLRVTSANLSGAMPATSAAEALKDVGLEADLTIDGGVSPGGVPSTVVKVEPDGALTVLREGAIAADEIRRVACGA
jgi:L-threonylcarbamoyladenylate synthase